MADCKEFLSLYKTLGGQSNLTQQCCNYGEVSCTGSAIVSINLVNMNGTLPDFSKLPSLETLSISGKFGGSVETINNPKIQSLTLASQNVVGNISALGAYKSLIFLDLSKTNVTGTVPSLSLQQCRLTSTVCTDDTKVRDVCQVSKCTSDSTDSGLSVGAVVGIAVGCVAIIVFGLWLLLYRRKLKRTPTIVKSPPKTEMLPFMAYPNDSYIHVEQDIVLARSDSVIVDDDDMSSTVSLQSFTKSKFKTMESFYYALARHGLDSETIEHVRLIFFQEDIKPSQLPYMTDKKLRHLIKQLPVREKILRVINTDQ
ncbi:hypothetical protein EDD86DRAFT_206325 [Gorgonomyces haynaldii]|nr:hypothetical protein EDD86DRAFT_206325 [Gorgonomyces haynaldii]